MTPGETPLERYASLEPAPKWGRLPQPVAVVAMAGGGAALFGLAKPLAVPTPVPTLFSTPPGPTPNGGWPVGAYSGCHQWRYTLHWDRPSRLATLKNALGNSVTLYKSYAAPGASAANPGGTQDGWPDPIDHSIDWTGAPNAGAWNWKAPPAAAAASFAWDHDCNDPVKGPVCGSLAAVGPDENPGIWYEAGWAGTIIYNLDYATENPTGPYPNPPGRITAATDPQGFVVDWQWTLNYGYGPNNEIIYGLDPGPPLAAYDMTTDTTGTGSSGLGGSIPGLTGTPLSFPSTWTTRGGALIPAPTVTGPTTAKPFETDYSGSNQPAWQKFSPADVIGTTASSVNWGLMTFQDNSVLDQSLWCSDPGNYNVAVPIVSDDSGPLGPSATHIESLLRLKYYNDTSYPGLSASGGTPSKGAITRAGDSITTSWNADPKLQCARPWGIILCTDGLSNTCDTGPVPDAEWGLHGNPPCEADIAGTDYLNYPPGAAEAVYNLNLHFGAGEFIKPRTYAIGIAPEVGRCELDRTAYRGRSDANAARGDAGFVLYDPCATACALQGDVDLPHLLTTCGAPTPTPTPVPSPTPSPTPTPVPAPTVIPEEDGTNPDRFRQDNGGLGPYDPTQLDYAFFALDTNAIVNAFLTIVYSTAAGDYSTSAPVSGGAISLGSIVLLPSTGYPNWEGHFRAFDTSGATPVLKWDAADVLNKPQQPWQPTPDKRAIYTWDPATGALISVDQTNLVNLAALAGGDPAFTANVVDFIRGFDGTLTSTSRFSQDALNPCKSKGWLLGPIVNSTPAVIGGPYQYKQTGNVADHRSFEAVYASRRPLSWVGSDDGMLHAFDFNDGTEVMALLPPNLLETQVALYANYTAGATATPPTSFTGQVGELDKHKWGVANSLRFADIYFGVGGYKTVGFLTEGPGGDLIAAVDLTHPFPGYASASPAVPPDPNYDPSNPVKILWTKNSSDYTGLFGTWSVPAVAPDAFTTGRMFFGAGINPGSLLASSLDATTFVVDPTDGTLNSAVDLPAIATPSPLVLVGQQSFADDVFFQTKSPGYLPDNIGNLDLQADLNGRIWFNWANTDFTHAPNSAIGIDLNYASGTATVSTTDSTGITTTKSDTGPQGPASPQPVYYAPAASGQGTSGCQIYAMASGSLYETSPTVSGWNVNRSGDPPSGSGYDSTLPPFTPFLYLGIGHYKITDGAFGGSPLGKDPLQQYVVRQRIGGEYPDALPLPPGDPTLSASHTKLGPNTQVTSSAILIVDSTGTGSENAIFLLYDPDAGCTGTSYVAILTFSAPACDAPVIGPKTGSSATTGIVTLGAGPGAASGITLTDTQLFAAQSGVGAAASAGLKNVPVNINSLAGNPTFSPIWWRDVK